MHSISLEKNFSVIPATSMCHYDFQDEGSRAEYPPGTSLELPLTKKKVQMIMDSHPNVYRINASQILQYPFEVKEDL